MKFVKRLVILSGENGKGTLAIECNSYGVFAKLNAFTGTLKALDLVMRIDGNFFVRRLNKEKISFSLEGIDSVNAVQAAVFSDGRLAMYGSNESKRFLATEAADFCLHIKNEKEPKFSTRLETENEKIIKLPYQKQIDKEIDSDFNNIDATSDKERGCIPNNTTKCKTDYGFDFERSLNADGFVAGFAASCADDAGFLNLAEKKNIYQEKTEYEDERLAEENFYPKELDADNMFSQAENSINLNAKAAKLLDYAVSPADLARAFLLGKLSAKKENEVHVAQADLSMQQQAAQHNFKREEKIFKPSIKIKSLQKKVLKIFGEEERLKTLDQRNKNENENLRQKSFLSDLTKDKIQAEAAAAKSFAVEKAFNSTNLTKNKSDSVFNGMGAERVFSPYSDVHVKGRASTFFEQNGEEIEKLFKNPREQDLEKLLPGSRWVKINYDKSGRFYVIGLIGKEFLCYGVPAEFSPQPPAELNGYCWWLPLMPDKPEGKGYWVMYQNLITGETVLPVNRDS